MQERKALTGIEIRARGSRPVNTARHIAVEPIGNPRGSRVAYTPRKLLIAGIFKVQTSCWCMNR